MTTSARVLVVNNRAADAHALAAALGRFGIEATGAAGETGARTRSRDQYYDAVVFDRLDASAAAISRLAIEMKARAQPRLLAFVAIGDEVDPAAPPQGVDAALALPAHPAQIAARIKLLLRLAVMEDEARLRAASLASRGIDVNLSFEEPRKKVNVLYVGDPSPAFLGLARELSEFGATTCAAFTTFTAFDFLHERDFDAVVIHATNKIETALAVATALRRNTRLYHTPAALLLDRDAFEIAETAFDRGVSELLPADAEPADMARRVMSLARERQRRGAVKRAFAQVRAPEVFDSVSGLATMGFFIHHFESMIRRSAHLERPLSLVVAKVEAPRSAQPAMRDLAIRQVGAMISRLMRAEDFAAELDPGVFAIAMPGARQVSAEGAAQRVAAIAECTAFGGGAAADSFQVELRCEVAQRGRTESARALLARAAGALDGAFTPPQSSEDPSVDEQLS
ncbi:MAG: hypothetical protein PVI23_12225 [Maricaulaceae bacterium]|jgi:two-component system cell cycle response regulator PopA